MLTNLFCRLQKRISLTAIFLAYLSIAVLLTAPAVLSTNSAATKTASNTRRLNATTEISAATMSLQSGRGPSGLGQVNCSLIGLGSTFCETDQIGPAVLA